MTGVLRIQGLHNVLAVCLALQAVAQTPPADEWSSLTAQATRAYDRGAYAESERLYSSALVLADKVGTPEDRLAASLSNLGTAYRAEGRYTEAEKLYQRALAIWQKAPQADQTHLVTALSNLAGIYRLEARYTEAEPLYRDALAICEQALGPVSVDAAVVLNNL